MYMKKKNQYQSSITKNREILKKNIDILILMVSP